MFANEFIKYITVQKGRDEKTIKIVEERLKGCRRKNKDFCRRVNDICITMDTYACGLSKVLEEGLNSPLVELFLGQPFNLEMVETTLKDKKFIGFLFVSGLMSRTLDLGYQSKLEIKLRIYLAILNFNEYEQQKY